jgi:hypothetical protein
MGSFNVSCAISNLGINERDKIGFLILEKNPVYRGRNYPESGKVLIINATDTYKPFLPPVFGAYNDYGNITGIKESVTTGILETMFRRPVQDVIDCICDDNDIYQMGSKISKHYMVAKLPDRFSRDSIGDGLMEAGFTKLSPEDSVATSFRFGDYEITLDSVNKMWTIIDNARGKTLKQVSTFSSFDELLNTFGEYTKTYPGFDPADYEIIRSLNKLGGMFFLEKVFEGMHKFNSADHYMNNYENTITQRFVDEWKEFLVEMEEAKASGKNILATSVAYGEFDFFRRDMNFPSQHIGLVDRYAESFDELLSVRSLIRTAENINRPLGPSVYSSIGENDRASKMLHNIVGDILGERQKEWEDDNFDPEEGEENNYWTLPG